MMYSFPGKEEFKDVRDVTMAGRKAAQRKHHFQVYSMDSSEAQD